jgi:hypothetical protein
MYIMNLNSNSYFQGNLGEPYFIENQSLKKGCQSNSQKDMVLLGSPGNNR